MNDDYSAYYLMQGHTDDRALADFESYCMGNFRSDEEALEWASSRYKITEETRLVKLVAVPQITLKLVDAPK